VGRQFFAGWLLMAMAIAAFIFLTRQRTQNFTHASSLVERSHQSLNEIERIFSSVKDADSGHRDYLLTGNDASLEPFRSAQGGMAKELERLREFISDNPEQMKRLEVLQGIIAQKMDNLRNNIEVRRTQGFEAAQAELNSGRSKKLMEDIRLATADMRQAEEELLAVRDRLQEEQVHTFNQFFWIDGIFILLCVLGIAMFIGKSLERKLQKAIAQVQGSSSELHTAASQQVTGAREQASATTEISTTVKELLATSRQIASSVQQVARVADDTAGAARTGNDTVQRAQEAIDAVSRQVDAIVNHMLDLGKRSQEIGGILDIINELAEQTNILAINATIESAGAGEHGRRFAVVAEEIRKLADRVGGATKDIRVLIDEIRAASNTTIMATEDGSKAVQGSAKQFSEVAGSFRRIAELVRTNLDVAREIELSTQQQTTAVEQVNTAIQEVAQTAQQSQVSSTQTLETANRLTQLSQQLNAILDARATAS
jgi:methyl-accepting chemotaxis protein